VKSDISTSSANQSSADEIIESFSSKYVVQEYVTSQYQKKTVLTVKDFDKDDVGIYRCIAKNSLGEVNSIAFDRLVKTSHFVFIIVG
jgi:hypothetical protein